MSDSPFHDALADLGDAVFAHLGRAATFTPAGGAPASVRVLLLRPDVVFGLTDARVVAPDATLEAPVAGVARRPTVGDSFTLGGQVWRVLEPARDRDGDGLVWSVDVERAP